MGRPSLYSKEMLHEIDIKVKEFVMANLHKDYLLKFRDTKLSVRGLLDMGQKKIKENETNSLLGFSNPLSFLNWWILAWKKQEGKCIYCDVQFSDINSLIDSGKLKTRSGKGNSCRGPFPEVERINGFDGLNVYSEENCALICYYCNNDKSNVYSSSDYKKYFGPAKKRFVDHLLGKVKD